jgi:NAD-dependent SIR2 family protein deacetylase
VADSTATTADRDARTADAIAEALTALAGRRLAILTGAGVSTDSGIPDYRGKGAPVRTPMTVEQFLASEDARRRYWVGSHLGWQAFAAAAPNPGHLALASLESQGIASGVVTQNVDGLHSRAGSRMVVNLHGEIAWVVCLDCGDRTRRADVQRRLTELNPGLEGQPPAEHAELRPDGDAVVQEWQHFVLADCSVCGGRLKPDVVFFGESVPKDRVQLAYDLIDAGEVLVVLGSSLTVMSGLRFVRHLAKQGRDVVIVNRGVTRGDPLATVKIDGGCAETLVPLVEALRSAW